LPRVCQVEGCGRPYLAKGYCRPHYGRAYCGRDVTAPIRGYIPNWSREPDAEGRYQCNTCAHWFPVGHFRRQKRSPNGLSAACKTCDAERCGKVYRGGRSIHNECGVSGAHARVYREWGLASQYPCVECGGTAKDWAYDGTDPTQLFVESNSGRRRSSTRKGWLFVSRYPEFYMPMCKKCHKSMDGARQQQELFEYRQWKHATGLTLADITVAA
jgi:hypothetical protein